MNIAIIECVVCDHTCHAVVIKVRSLTCKLMKLFTSGLQYCQYALTHFSLHSL